MYLIDCFPFFYALSTAEESSEDTEYPVAESSLVKDEFAEGEYCEKLYSQMLEAYERVCRRLGKLGTEDEDVEIIISNLMSIGRHQSMKMFDYGVLFTERENKQ